MLSFQKRSWFPFECQDTGRGRARRPAGWPADPRRLFSLLPEVVPSHGYCHGEKCDESPSDAPHLSLLSPEMNLWSQCASMFNKNTSLSVLGCVSISQMSDRIPLLRLQKRFLSISNDIRLIGSNVYASLYNWIFCAYLKNVKEKIVF